jgi:hypothetical protein
VGSQWKVYKRPLARCISSPEPLYSLRLLDALRRATDASLVDELSQLLVVRAGVRPKSHDKKDVISAVRQSLGGSGNSAIAMADRWRTLQEEAEAVLTGPLSTKDESQLLARAVLLAHFTTLAIALVQGDAGLATYDAGLANPPELPTTRASSESDADELFDKAGEIIAQNYRQRCALLNALTTRADSVQTSSQAVEQFIAITAAKAGAKADNFLAQLPFEQRAARFLAANDLQYTVALQRLLVELTAHHAAAERPQRAAAARRIAAEASAVSATADSSLAQLHCHEAALLRLWLLYAPEA